MIDRPDDAELRALLGARAFSAWNKLTRYVEDAYPGFAEAWFGANKAGVYELKYRKSGKTLCSFYPREKCFGFMLIFGAAERDKFEMIRDSVPPDLQQTYNEAKTYHDGKWVLFDVRDGKGLDEFKPLLAIKRKPARA